jgi:uncharacterized protein YciI
MEFVLYCIDAPDAAPTRARVRLAHLEHALRHRAHFRYGGPLLDDAGATKGSLMVMDFPDRPALDAYLAGDPYFQSGMFASVAVWPSRQIFPEVVPGALQRELQRQREADAAAAR